MRNHTVAMGIRCFNYTGHGEQLKLFMANLHPDHYHHGWNLNVLVYYNLLEWSRHEKISPL